MPLNLGSPYERKSEREALTLKRRYFAAIGSSARENDCR